MINNFNNFIKIIEDYSFGPDEPEFKVGDMVLVLPRLEYHIKERDWSDSMYDYIGKIYEIDEIREPKNNRGYRYYLKDDPHFFVYDDCIELANKNKEAPRIRWYKKGKLE